MSDRPSPYNTKNNNTKNNSESANLQIYKQGSLFGEAIERTSRLYDSGASYQMGSQSLQVWKTAIAVFHTCKD